jgi:hypothetical protein
MNKKLITYTLLFSFLLTVAGCFTTKYYNDTPEVLITKEQGKKDFVYDDLDSMTLINNKTIDLDLHTAQFIKSRTDSSYKFVYYYPRVVFDTAKMLALKSNKAFYKDAVPDTLDIRNISMIHYTTSELDSKKTNLTIGLSILIPLVTIGIIYLIAVLPYALGRGHP